MGTPQLSSGTLRIGCCSLIVLLLFFFCWRLSHLKNLKRLYINTKGDEPDGFGFPLTWDTPASIKPRVLFILGFPSQNCFISTRQSSKAIRKSCLENERGLLLCRGLGFGIRPPFCTGSQLSNASPPFSCLGFPVLFPYTCGSFALFFQQSSRSHPVGPLTCLLI